jgi:uncharacterized protein (TIGR00297 family)
MPTQSTLLWAFLINALLAAITMLVGAASFTCALWGTLAGVCIYSGFGYGGMAILAAFIAVAHAATRYRYSEKTHRASEPAGGRRTGRQAVACLAIPAVCGLLAFQFRSLPITLAYLCAIATALADTLSGELGQVFCSRPGMIGSLRAVAPGTDGAVSLQGLVDGAAGAALIALLAIPAMGLPWRLVWIVIFAGILGDLADSAIGAKLPSSVPLGNETTNLLSTAIGAILGGVLCAAA